MHDVIGRDVRVDQLKELEQGLGAWLSTCEGVLHGVEQRMMQVGGFADSQRAESVPTRSVWLLPRCWD